jgi:hypothetical protein
MDGSKENPILFFEEDGSGPHEHVCAMAPGQRVASLQGWLDREILIGGVSPEVRREFERAIEDIRAGG